MSLHKRMVPPFHARRWGAEHRTRVPQPTPIGAQPIRGRGAENATKLHWAAAARTLFAASLRGPPLAARTLVPARYCGCQLRGSLAHQFYARPVPEALSAPDCGGRPRRGCLSRCGARSDRSPGDPGNVDQDRRRCGHEAEQKFAGAPHARPPATDRRSQPVWTRPGPRF
jgi:hypothetical protein